MVPSYMFVVVVVVAVFEVQVSGTGWMLVMKTKKLATSKE